MKINRFFETVLNAPPKNIRWSWGGVDYKNRRVFLRVWDDPLSLDAASERVLVLDRVDGGRDGHNHGYNERLVHLGLHGAGYSLYGVLCHHSGAQDRNAGLIESYDRDQLLQLGALHETINGTVYAEIDERIPVSKIATPRELSIQRDLEDLTSSRYFSETTRAALVQARLGQGQFRQDLMNRYEHRCAVTGVAIADLLRASHIKPWARSTNKERLDPNNGLLLTPALDALFDRGFITFKKDGAVRISRQLDASAKAQLGPIAGLAVRPTARQAEYLKFHAAHVYRGDA